METVFKKRVEEQSKQDKQQSKKNLKIQIKNETAQVCDAPIEFSWNLTGKWRSWI